ncbi:MULTISPECIES: cytochrome c551 [Virgibacillus]|uniref:Cytochrome c n=1 Tax=Virgibacillus dokdonensis TaxID=302167 RepID=A0A2K9IZU4_9BACI|nr:MULTISPECIES: cytochrome c [Virgibacillus]AUJ23271.1 Cytochrome c-551 precursor [Virgibacillus dokdonensis]NWO14040.1 cytochrome c [Virgibacillus sp.]
MKKWLLAMLFGTVLVLGACGGGDDENASEEPADKDDAKTEENSGSVDATAAEEVYQDNCLSCHGADLSGGNAPALTDVGSKYSSDEIADIIKNGKGSMPAGMAKGDDVQLLADWLAEKK